MRCPKCHYLSFDPEPRCKNCGYDLEVADAELAFKSAEDYSDDVPDLEIRRTETLDLPGLTLEVRREVPTSEPVAVAAGPREPAAPRVSQRRAPRVRKAPQEPAALQMVANTREPAHTEAVEPEPVHLEPVQREPEVESTFRIEPIPEPVSEPLREQPPMVAAHVVPPSSTRATGVALFDPPAHRRRATAPTALPPSMSSPSVSAHPTTEMPLFVRDAPAALPPLSVRRTMAEPRGGHGARESAAPAKERRVGPLDRDLLDDLRRVEREESAYASIESRVLARADRQESFDDDYESDEIPATQRLAAAALDGMLLGGIGTFVLWATLRVTGVGITSFGTDSIVPLLVFLGGVSIAYLLMFTAAGGQTVGKMLMGLRVVGDTADSIDDRLTIGQAALRAVLAPLSVLALGLGWLPALFGRGLALHDRLAHTRVVRA